MSISFQAFWLHICTCCIILSFSYGYPKDLWMLRGVLHLKIGAKVVRAHAWEWLYNYFVRIGRAQAMQTSTSPLVLLTLPCRYTLCWFLTLKFVNELYLISTSISLLVHSYTLDQIQIIPPGGSCPINTTLRRKHERLPFEWLLEVKGRLLSEWSQVEGIPLFCSRVILPYWGKKTHNLPLLYSITVTGACHDSS